MTFPEVFPVFTYNDILEPPASEYAEGDKKTMVGWLKDLILFHTCEDNADCLQVRPEDRKDYEKALDIVRKECKMGARDSIDEWEETATRKRQAAVLNVVRKKLGYTEECWSVQ